MLCFAVHKCILVYISEHREVLFSCANLWSARVSSFLSWNDFYASKSNDFGDPHIVFMWKMLSEMRKERNGDEYKEIRRASCSIEKSQNG